jgi:predicted Ser/Thr protein kinase
MSPDSPETKLDSLPLPQDVRRRCESAWQDGRPAPLEDCLADTPEPDRTVWLRQLLAEELAWRRRQCDHLTPDEYISRFSQYSSVIHSVFSEVMTSHLSSASNSSQAQPGLEPEATQSNQPTADFQAPTGRIPLPEVPGYEVLAEIGRGGMGVVYLARQCRLNRQVALKLLPPALAHDAHRLRRFHKEAAIAARLNEARILPVLDVVEAHGVPVLAFPYVDGCDLGRIILDRKAVKQGGRSEGRHSWASLSDQQYLDKVFPVLDMVLESAVALGQTGVLHRDFKPGNVLVDQRGNAWLADFGLARLVEEGGGLSVGTGLGTPGFMSPEQWEGCADLDARADVFGVGATVYAALTLELPYGKARLGPGVPPCVPVSQRQPLLPVGFDAVVGKALSLDRDNRYATAADLQADWQHVRRGHAPLAELPSRARQRRRLVPWYLGSAFLAAVAILVAAGWWLRTPNGDTPSSPPASSQTVSRSVLIETDEPGARLAIVPLDEYGQPEPQGSIRPEAGTPLTVDLRPGVYLVVAALSDGRFHEVYRTVPEPGQKQGGIAPHVFWDELDGGKVRLPLITIPANHATARMALIPAGQFTVAHVNRPELSLRPHRRQVESYYLDTTEVTVAVYREMMGSLPPRYPQVPRATFPVTWVSFDQAVACAELLGKRLPTEFEYEYAATQRGTRRYP